MTKRRSSNSSVDTLALEGEARSSRIRTTSPQRTRVIINFNDQSSTKIIIPVTSSTTIAELRSQVFGRAERLAVKIPELTTVLRLESADGPITFPEDTIEGVFGDVEPKLIWAASVHGSNGDGELVYVRWITPGRALDHLSLSDIVTDKDPLTGGMTVNEIMAIAKVRVFGATGEEVTPVPGFNIGLWFSKTGYDNTIWAQGTETINALGLCGSFENPLNAFLVLISADDADPNFHYGFRCSNRGMATFETCIEVLISAASFRPHLIPLLVDRMMLVTNVSEATTVLESFLRTDAVHESRALTIPANCFREIALRMIPSAFVGHKIESVLEGSRQIFAWMFGDILEEAVKPIKSNRMPLPSTYEFRNILNACNSSQYFQMLSPLQLDGRDNSGISLSTAGYVSQYTSSGDEPLQPRLENVITGSESLQSRPGQRLLQALQPVISQRRIDGTWEVDDWELKFESGLLVAPDSGPDEAIIICLDESISMTNPLGVNWIGNGEVNSLSRFDEAKQVFRNVIARLTAYHLNVHVGLLTFGKVIEQQTGISPIGKEFKNKLENAKATGRSTALFDALSKAKRTLSLYKELYPKSNMKLRIIALTDGEDNCSNKSPEDACRMLYEEDIVLDSIVIGGSSSEELFKISKHTGGYAFQPTSRLLLFQTFLLEPFLDILARPNIAKVALPNYWISSYPKEADMKTVHDFPPCRPHPLQEGSFFSLVAATRRLAGNSSSLIEIARSSSSAKPPKRSSGRLFLDEMRLMIANPQTSMDVYVSEVDMAFWKVIMSGPAFTAYSQGTFAFFVHMTEKYPQKAPTVRFITPVLHPNISKHGRVCHEILDDGWKSSLHIHDILEALFSLFENPKASCDAAIDELATLKFWTDPATVDTEIKNYVTRFATRTRSEWKSEMGSTA